MSFFSPPPGGNPRMYFFLFLLTLGNRIGFQGWTLLYTNFAVQVAGLSAAQNGLVHSIREIPGLLGILIILLLLILKEHRLCALSVFVTGLGTMLTGYFTDFWSIVATSLLMSFGFHYFESLNESLMIQYYSVEQTPLVMGKLRGLSAGGSLLVSVFIFFCTGYFSFKTMFLMAGGACAALAFWSFFIDPTDKTLPVQRRTMIVRRRYWLFYMLTFILGGRRQIFTVFALFLLVQKFGFSVQTVSILFMVNYGINWFLNPLIGRIIVRFGERRLLSLEYLSAIAIFLGYALTDSVYLVAALYILDSITFNFAIAVRTFFQKIADPRDVAPSMALSQTINHMAAVFIPSLGGWLWVTYGYQMPFYLGMGLAATSLCLAQLIDREVRKAAVLRAKAA